jgi:hypothetical protein
MFRIRYRLHGGSASRIAAAKTRSSASAIVAAKTKEAPPVTAELPMNGTERFFEARSNF